MKEIDNFWIKNTIIALHPSPGLSSLLNVYINFQNIRHQPPLSSSFSWTASRSLAFASFRSFYCSKSYFLITLLTNQLFSTILLTLVDLFLLSAFSYMSFIIYIYSLNISITPASMVTAALLATSAVLRSAFIVATD